MAYVQYIIVRKDLVPIMGVGKTAAQTAHASLAVILDGDKILDDPNIKGWLQSPFTKLVVYLKTKQKLLNLITKLNELGIRNYPIYDACRTRLVAEETNGTTLTCVGVIPMKRDEVPKCLSVLRLLD